MTAHIGELEQETSKLMVRILLALTRSKYSTNSRSISLGVEGNFLIFNGDSVYAINITIKLKDFSE
jgi:hypothetical protein